MSNDIAPELYAQIQKAFRANLENDKTLQNILSGLRSGVVTPEATARAAEHIGEAASRSLRVITPEALPNGQMYYNIAQRTVAPELRAVYNEVNAICLDAQKIQNVAAGIGLNPVSAPFPASRIDGIIERLCASPFSEIQWILGEPVINYSQFVHNNFIHVNADFQRKSGLKPMIIRRSESRCCDWCEGLNGQFVYGEQPDEFFHMHENCRCEIVFNPTKGESQRSKGRTITRVVDPNEYKRRERALLERDAEKALQRLARANG